MKKLTILLSMVVLTSFTYDTHHKNVIFLGDSLTQNGAAPGGFIELLKDELKKNGKGESYSLIGKGVGGNRVRELLARLENDVIKLQPDWVVIMVGINDVGFFTWHPEDGGTPIDQYELALTYMVKRIRQKGGSVILCTPTIIEEKYDGTNPLDKELNQYAQVVREVAYKTNSRLCDMRKACINYLELNNPENKLQGVLTTDYVHFNSTGNKLLMTNLLPFFINLESN